MGGYNAMKPLLELINSSKSFNLNIAVTDQHLIKKFGYTYNRIKKILGQKLFLKYFQIKLEMIVATGVLQFQRF